MCRFISYSCSLLCLLFYSVVTTSSSCSADNSAGNLSSSQQFLDYAASWKISDIALDTFCEVSKMYGNSSGINPHAKHLKKLERQSADIIAHKIHAQNGRNIHFTNGATAANNIAILGVAHKNPGCHIITSKIEHKSVLNVAKHLEQNGWKVTYLDVDRFGRIDIEQLRKSICKDTRLISIQMFNSEIGTFQDIAKIGKIAHESGVLFHCDAAQSFCKYPIDVESMHIDLLTMTGHKIGGPKGIGALYIRDSDKLMPIMFGSGDAFVPGTKPTPLICAFAAAVENFSYNLQQIRKNFDTLVAELRKIDNVYINSAAPSHVVSVSIGGILLNDLLKQLPQFSFSAGCSCLGKNKSNVIAAIDPEGKLPSTTIRISFSDQISEDDLRKFAQQMKATVEKMRAEKAVGQKNCSSNENDDETQELKNSLDKINELISK